jgi:hypothetical protein
MRFLIATLFFCFSATLLAQEQCGSDALMMGMPRSQRMMPPPEIDLDTAEVIVVPIVFHIVHKGEAIGEGTNISDEQIQSCVTALNEDFRKIEGTNGDGLGVDTKIEFCLASRSPENLPTTGIVRHDASDLVYEVTFSGQYQMVTYMEDGVTSSGAFTSSLQGIPADWMKQQLGCWDTEKYFNMWIVSEIDGNNGGGGIQGFSYVGHYASNCFAGPVQLYNVTGTTGNIKTGNLNKTTSHEIGHAFNLYHTFGFGGGSCTETNCETQGDQVCDTPPTSANQSCNPNFASCPDAQLENYMDYTPQSCRNTFTQGQAERMREELWTQLNGFTQSLGCVPVVDVDGGISNMAISNPNCETTFDVTISIANFGIQDLTNPTITLSNGSSQTSVDLDVTLTGGQSTTAIIEFSSLVSSTIEAEVVFDQAETFVANNQSEAEFVYVEGNVLTIELSPDVWSNELDWELVDEQGEIVASGGDYPVFSQDSTFVDEVCLFGDCYTFSLYDSNGDGMCSIDFDDDGSCDAFYDALLRLTLNSEVIFEIVESEDMDFGSVLNFDFCDEVVDCNGDVDGDNMVGVDDLLIMLANIGCVSLGEPCEGDLNGDGTTDVNDLNEVLAHYGETCSGLVLIEENNPPVLGQKPSLSLAKNSQNRMGFYDLSGRWIGNDRERLRQGIYILVELKDGDVVQSKVFIQ